VRNSQFVRIAVNLDNKKTGILEGMVYAGLAKPPLG